jgi:hypothetical protein
MNHLNEKSIFEHLLKLQNLDGGWSSAPGKQSNPEATAYALMALVQHWDQAEIQPRINEAITWLLGRQDESGAWYYAHEARQGFWVTAPVLLSLSPFVTYREELRRGAAWLLRQKGERLNLVQTLRYWLWYQKRNGGINPNLPGWSWASGTTSWVEPTAFALLVLNKLRPALDLQAASERIRYGEALLYDRVCEKGGWNQGKGMALGKQIPPYPDTTAIALIALQAHRDKPENQTSLDMLNKMIARQRSGLILSWAIICRFMYGQDNETLKAQLLMQYQKTRFLGRTKPLALSLVALGDPSAYFQV